MLVLRVTEALEVWALERPQPIVERHLLWLRSCRKRPRICDGGEILLHGVRGRADESIPPTEVNESVGVGVEKFEELGRKEAPVEQWLLAART